MRYTSKREGSADIIVYLVMVYNNGEWVAVRSYTSEKEAIDWMNTMKRMKMVSPAEVKVVRGKI